MLFNFAYVLAFALLGTVTALPQGEGAFEDAKEVLPRNAMAGQKCQILNDGSNNYSSLTRCLQMPDNDSSFTVKNGFCCWDNHPIGRPQVATGYCQDWFDNKPNLKCILATGPTGSISAALLSAARNA